MLKFLIIVLYFEMIFNGYLKLEKFLIKKYIQAK